MTTETKQLQFVVSEIAPSDLKEYIEVMIRYHHCLESTAFKAPYRNKRTAQHAKKHPELIKELVEAATWNNCSWHRGHVVALLSVYDFMGYGVGTLIGDLLTDEKCQKCPRRDGIQGPDR